MTTATHDERALDLVTQASELLDGNDERQRLLEAICSSGGCIERKDEWRHDTAEGDPRWWALATLLRYDGERASGEDPLFYDTLRLLVQIADQTVDMILLRGEHSNREDVQQRSRELRDATARLERIVQAVTAVHVLDEVAS